MKLAIVRHAIAENRKVFARRKITDRLRPLTSRGRKRMKRNAVGILQIVPEIDVLATSPLTRAFQTAEILQDFYKKKDILKIPELEPQVLPEKTIEWLQRLRQKNMVMVVGHEPHLSQLINSLLGGKSSSLFSMKKGGLCLIDFPGKIEGGRGKLLCFAQPTLLRRVT